MHMLLCSKRRLEFLEKSTNTSGSKEGEEYLISIVDLERLYEQSFDTIADEANKKMKEFSMPTLTVLLIFLKLNVDASIFPGTGDGSFLDWHI